MVLPSVDTYLQSTISKSLKLMLVNPALVKSLLKEFDKEATDNFVTRYCNTANEIPIVFQFPTDHTLLQGFVLISLLNGEEKLDSIGNVLSEYDSSNGDVVMESSVVTKDEDNEDESLRGLEYIEVSTDVSSVESIINISFDSGEPILSGKRIYFSCPPEVIGETFTVYYTPVDADSVPPDQVNIGGITHGFNASESYGITCYSTNMDIVRCLSRLVTAIMITMRSSIAEQYSIALQHVTYGDVDAVDPYGSDSGQLVYGRQLTVSYTVPYGLDVQDAIQINKLIVEGAVKTNGKTNYFHIKDQENIH